MTTATYLARRAELQTYFDRTAVEAWKRLTSDAPVSGIRATVRAGRDRMRTTLLSWLPDDLPGVLPVPGLGQALLRGARAGGASSLPRRLHLLGRRVCPLRDLFSRGGQELHQP